VRHVLGVDEDLERPPRAFVIGVRVIDGDVDGVGVQRPADLVGRAFEPTGARRQRIDVGRRSRRGNGGRRLDAEHRAGDGVGAIGGQPLATHPITLTIDIRKRLKVDVFRAVDRLRDRAVDLRLRRRLHPQVMLRGQGLGADEGVAGRAVERRVRAFERLP